MKRGRSGKGATSLEGLQYLAFCYRAIAVCFFCSGGSTMLVAAGGRFFAARCTRSATVSSVGCSSSIAAILLCFAAGSARSTAVIASFATGSIGTAVRSRCAAFRFGSTTILVRSSCCGAQRRHEQDCGNSRHDEILHRLMIVLLELLMFCLGFFQQDKPSGGWKKEPTKAETTMALWKNFFVFKTRALAATGNVQEARRIKPQQAQA